MVLKSIYMVLKSLLTKSNERRDQLRFNYPNMYIEAVIDETFRMFPPAQRLERIVTNNIEYGHLKLKNN